MWECGYTESMWRSEDNFSGLCSFYPVLEAGFLIFPTSCICEGLGDFPISIFYLAVRVLGLGLQMWATSDFFYMVYFPTLVLELAWQELLPAEPLASFCMFLVRVFYTWVWWYTPVILAFGILVSLSQARLHESLSKRGKRVLFGYSDVPPPFVRMVVEKEFFCIALGCLEIHCVN